MNCLAPALLVLLVASCQPKPDESADNATQEPATQEPATQEPATQEVPSTAMGRDLDRICNAEELSGALELQPGERAMHVGIWLAETIESQEARDLSAGLTQLAVDERIARLQQELAKHDIKSCEILNAWRGGE